MSFYVCLALIGILSRPLVFCHAYIHLSACFLQVLNCLQLSSGIFWYLMVSFG